MRGGLEPAARHRQRSRLLLVRDPEVPVGRRTGDLLLQELAEGELQGPGHPAEVPSG